MKRKTANKQVPLIASIALSVFTVLFTVTTAVQATDPLSLWNDTAPKKALVAFVIPLGP